MNDFTTPRPHRANPQPPRGVVVRNGDLCALPHVDQDGRPGVEFAFHVRDGRKVCTRHAYEIDRGYAA